MAPVIQAYAVSVAWRAAGPVVGVVVVFGLVFAATLGAGGGVAALAGNGVTGAGGSSACAAATPGAGPASHATALTPEQAANAATIVAVGARLGVPVQGQVVAIATALQESGLRNLDHGDRDSLGLFQQRAGWGTVAQRMDPATSAGLFFRALVVVPNWQSLPVTVAAQRVQASAYPDAYAKWETTARVAVGAAPATCQPAAASVQPVGDWQAHHLNGRIPVSELCTSTVTPTAWFRCDAAEAFDRLSAAYAARFGRPLGVTDSYRTYASQVSVYARKPGLAARPGTSNHGWGLAADLVVGGYGDARYLWMRANAPSFGWDNPGWARPGGSKREPWHFEYHTPR
jgi:hypothetical protein